MVKEPYEKYLTIPPDYFGDSMQYSDGYRERYSVNSWQKAVSKSQLLFGKPESALDNTFALKYRSNLSDNLEMSPDTIYLVPSSVKQGKFKSFILSTVDKIKLGVIQIPHPDFHALTLDIPTATLDLSTQRGKILLHSATTEENVEIPLSGSEQIIVFGGINPQGEKADRKVEITQATVTHPTQQRNPINVTSVAIPGFLDVQSVIKILPSGENPLIQIEELPQSNNYFRKLSKVLVESDKVRYSSPVAA
ncbi:MAG TPA: hypothetical protein VF189_02945 [Patescibacteria group bacterium]